MTNAAAIEVNPSLKAQAQVLAREVREAHESLHVSLSELEGVLGQPVFNPGALTSARLKLAGLRLTRGPLISKVGALLFGRVSEGEAALLSELNSSHYQLLRTATAHTGKWTLEAIGRDWAGYRRQTRELTREWAIKADKERRLVVPLIERIATQN